MVIAKTFSLLPSAISAICTTGNQYPDETNTSTPTCSVALQSESGSHASALAAACDRRCDSLQCGAPCGITFCSGHGANGGDPGHAHHRLANVGTRPIIHITPAAR